MQLAESSEERELSVPGVNVVSEAAQSVRKYQRMKIMQ